MNAQDLFEKSRTDKETLTVAIREAIAPLVPELARQIAELLRPSVDTKKSD